MPELRTPLLAVIGKTGSGKSSLLNALFGLCRPTGNVVATTKEIVIEPAKLVTADTKRDVLVADTPGFAESTDTEAVYRDMYTKVLPCVDHVLWVAAAHPRVFRPDQDALELLGPALAEHASITVALTRADTIGPHDWDEVNERPSAGQEQALAEQVRNVTGKLRPFWPFSDHDVFPCSAPRDFGLNPLLAHLDSTMFGEMNEPRT